MIEILTRRCPATSQHQWTASTTRWPCLRRPAQRLLSAFRDRKHADGFQDRDKAANWRDLNASGLRAASRHRRVYDEDAAGAGARTCTKSEETARATNEAGARRRPARREGDGRGPAPRLCGFAGAGPTPSASSTHMLGGAPRKIEFVVAHSRRRRGRDAPLVPDPLRRGRLDGR